MRVLNMVLVLFSLLGCSSTAVHQGEGFLVEKRIGDDRSYEFLHNIEDQAAVGDIIKLLDHIDWENAEVSMVEPPHYRFYLKQNKTGETQHTYDMWISPGEDQIEMLVEGEGKYTQLSKRKSVRLYELVTGEELGAGGSG